VALTRRGRVATAFGGALALVTVGVGALALTGHAPTAIQKVVDGVTGQDHLPPPTCPLTGKAAPGHEVPDRPALAVKVENTAEAYPLAGLQKADVVYEEIVEGGITRFMAVYHCADAARVGPVRSARTTDAKLLMQFEPHSVMAYSGGQLAVVRAVQRSGLVSYDEGTGGAAFRRDATRPEPHNLFVNTAKLWATSAKTADGEGPPRRILVFDGAVPEGGKRVRTVTIPFSYSVEAIWTWVPGQSRWQRLYLDEPMMLEGDRPITAANVVIQQVVVTASNLVDVLGNPSPEVAVTGSGKAWILRNGRLIRGRWVRPVMGAVTKFETRTGEVIPLAPGNTWIELLPKGNPPTFAK
jgi:DUF3048 family protein